MLEPACLNKKKLDIDIRNRNNNLNNNIIYGYTSFKINRHINIILYLYINIKKLFNIK